MSDEAERILDVLERIAHPRPWTYFVGLNGDDSADGLSWETRMATMSEALRRQEPGDRIVAGWRENYARGG